MKRGHGVAFHLAALVGAALIHHGWHAEPQQEEQEPAPDAVEPPAGVHAQAWADWLYTTRLLALDRPLHTWRVEDDPDPEGWSHRSWHEMAIRAENSGDLDVALKIWERYRPPRYCGLDPEPEWAARRYADLCHRMGRRACFLTQYLQLLGNELLGNEIETDVDFSFIARLPSLGIDRRRFVRGLVYQFDSAEVARVERLELEPARLALAIERGRLTDVMLPWLRREARNTKLDDRNRRRAEQTLHYLRDLAGSLLLRSSLREGRR